MAMDSDDDGLECGLDSPFESLDLCEMDENSAVKRIQYLQESTGSPEFSKPEKCKESNVVKLMWRYIEKLAVKGKDAEEMLQKERLENLVSKVEKEVEFEGLVKGICMQMKAKGEFLDMERREREWEIERREIQLEEEVEALRSKADKLEKSMRIVGAEEQAFHNNKEEASGHARPESEVAPNKKLEYKPFLFYEEDKIHAVANYCKEHCWKYEVMFEAFQEMLSEAEERTNEERKKLEQMADEFHMVRQSRNDREMLLESKISTLENELSRTTEILEEKELMVRRDRERNKQYVHEVDQTLAFWRDQAEAHKKVCERLKYCETQLHDIREKVIDLQELSAKEEWASMQRKLLELAEVARRDMHEEEFYTPKQEQSFENEYLERLKAQRDLLEDERFKLEEKLHFVMKKASEEGRRIEATWMERERIWLEKVHSMETKLKNQETLWNNKETSFNEERRLWKLEVETSKKNWEEETENLRVIAAETEQSMGQKLREYASLFDDKEDKLSSLISLQKRIFDVLIVQKQRLREISKYLVRNRKSHAKKCKRRSQKDHSSIDDRAELCTGESDQGLSFLMELSVGNKDQVANTDGLDLERLAVDVEIEIDRINKELNKEQERLEKERREVTLGTEELKQERKELEKKVSEILSLMEDLKAELKAKEGQMEWERKQMEQILMANTCETKELREKLGAKEDEIHKIKEELRIAEQEINKEQKEQEVMDLPLTACEKVKTESKENEAIWKKEGESMLQEIQDLKKDIYTKDQKIALLEKEIELITKFGYGREYTDEDEIIGHFGAKNPIQEKTSTETEKYGGKDRLSFGISEMQICPEKNELELHAAIERITGFDKQIADAMLAIQNLKGELNAKEKELQTVRLVREPASTVVDAVLHQEYEHAKHMQRQQEHNELQLSQEQTLSKEREELLNLLEAERADTADALAVLQGAVRELHWELNHYKGKDAEECNLDFGVDLTMVPSKNLVQNNDLVVVPASHLEEVDHFAIDLKLKVDEAEKKAKAAEVALSVKEVKDMACESTLGQVRKNATKLPGHEKVGQEDNLSFFQEGGGSIFDNRFEGMLHKLGKVSNEKFTVQSSQGIPILWQEKMLTKGSIGQGESWDNAVNGTRSDYPGSCGARNRKTGSHNQKMAKERPDGSPCDMNPYKQGFLALTIPTHALTSRRRWLVDASWLDHVRKEQSFLMNQLEQRAYVLDQIEAENTLMEAAVALALEQKRESDLKVLELEQKVAFLELRNATRCNREIS